MARYLKHDCELGYVENNAEIEYLKFNNLRHSVLGNMMGDFDENGYYVIQPDIVKELIEMKKFITDSEDNIEICKGELKLDRQFTFMVTFEEDKATLALLEKISYEANFKIDSGVYCNINEYILDQVETSGKINRNLIYQRWNISEYEGNLIDIFNCDDAVLEKYFGIVNRFKYLLKSNKILLAKETELEQVEREYTFNILDILKRYPEFEKKVKEQVKQTMLDQKDFIRLDQPNFAKTFNEVLDRAIDENINQLDEKDKNEFQTDRRAAQLDATIKKNDILGVETITYKSEIIAEYNSLPNQEVNVLQINTKTENSFKSVNEYAKELAAVLKEKTKERKEFFEKVTKGDSNVEDTIKLLKAFGMAVSNFVAQVEQRGLIKDVVQALAKQERKSTTNTADNNQREVVKGFSTGGKSTGGKSTGGRSSGGSSSGGGSATGNKNAKVETNQTGQKINADNIAQQQLITNPLFRRKKRGSNVYSYVPYNAQGMDNGGQSTDGIRKVKPGYEAQVSQAQVAVVTAEINKDISVTNQGGKKIITETTTVAVQETTFSPD